MKRAAGLRLSLRALGGRLGAQWERERRDTLFLMLPVLIAVLPHLRWLPWWVGVGFLVLFAWRLGLLFSGRWLPRAAVRWVAAIAAAAAVWAQYDTLIGREPGVALLVLLLGLKLMEMQVRRDLFVVISLSMFLLLASFLHAQSIGVAALVLIGLAGLLAAMLTMQYHQLEAPIARRLRAATALILQALPLAAVLFVLFPRPGGPLWGLPGEAAGARTGLSETMRPGLIAELGESREIAFRVQFDGPVPPPVSLYWRGPTFGNFDGATWRALPPDRAAVANLSIDESESIRYSVTQEASSRPWLFALEMPAEVRMPPGIFARLAPDFLLVSSRPIASRLRFEARSSSHWRIGLNETEASLAPWRALPEGFNPRTLALAREWRSGDPSATPSRQQPDAGRDQSLVERALELFREQAFRYTLRPPALGRHSVDEFLFDTRAGFCEHFAAAFVVLMRALDIPARVVTGYQGGELNPVDGWWLVRQADAHAWAEVWLPERGWVRFDPTAAVAPDRIERGVRLEARLAALPGMDLAAPLFERLRFRLDAVTNLWNQWLLSYDRGKQERLLGRIGLEVDDWRSVAGAIALSLTLLIGAIAVLTLHPRRARDPVERLWDEFCERLALAGHLRLPHETALTFLRRVEPTLEDGKREAARQIVALYNRLRYEQDGTARDEPDTRQRDDMRHLRQCVRQFKP